MAPGSVAAPALTLEERAALEKGVAEFNRRHYYECHETLEDLWAGVRGPSRDFFQGLIQVAVGFYHLGNDNPVGAGRLFRRALQRLEPYPAHYSGVDLGALRASVADWQRALDAPHAAPPGPPPRLRRVSPDPRIV